MYNRLRRIVALLTVVFIVVLLIATVICAVTGSRYFFGMLFLTIVVPIVLWVFMWFTHLVNDSPEVIEPQEDVPDSQNIGDECKTESISNKQESE